MDFSEALREIKKGKRLRRAGWNGKEQWIALIQGEVVRRLDDPIHESMGSTNTVGAYIGIYIPETGVWQPGWLASQADMLAEDWQALSPRAQLSLTK